jgi:hypothetical protein
LRWPGLPSQPRREGAARDAPASDNAAAAAPVGTHLDLGAGGAQPALGLGGFGEAGAEVGAVYTGRQRYIEPQLLGHGQNRAAVGTRRKRTP